MKNKKPNLKLRLKYQIKSRFYDLFEILLFKTIQFLINFQNVVKNIILNQSLINF